ncbi:MmcQ/YjbR family DNA-binding protein [Paenibacillus gorillae]|uniref:MmcQ/YjbR family DNA-binding protein n=1 Tax=Paenibacillus gorillae TaxID=1243662 RepID=UPI0004AF0A0E|nr:MmcQ/YjbR family DNA-binding protein [Paenibacillus gorillae]
MTDRVTSSIEYCDNKPGAVQEYPFGPQPLVMKVGGKMFAFFSKDSITLKCDPHIAENLREQYADVKPGYHMNKKHWNTVMLEGTLTEEELQSMMDHSYELVVAALPKAVRQALQT